MHDKIDSCKWIHLREFGEPVENSLRIVIAEAKADGPADDIEVLPGKIISDLRAIESDESCRLFELVWPNYVAYSVRNESFCTVDESEQWEGRLFCLYAKSHYLEFVSKATFANAAYPGPLQHWGINCLNHIVDIVSTSEPQVRSIRQTSQESLPRGDN
jgi:hypothetical protein